MRVEGWHPDWPIVGNHHKYARSTVTDDQFNGECRCLHYEDNTLVSNSIQDIEWINQVYFETNFVFTLGDYPTEITYYRWHNNNLESFVIDLDYHTTPYLSGCWGSVSPSNLIYGSGSNLKTTIRTVILNALCAYGWVSPSSSPSIPSVSNLYGTSSNIIKIRHTVYFGSEVIGFDVSDHPPNFKINDNGLVKIAPTIADATNTGRQCGGFSTESSYFSMNSGNLYIYAIDGPTAQKTFHTGHQSHIIVEESFFYKLKNPSSMEIPIMYRNPDSYHNLKKLGIDNTQITVLSTEWYYKEGNTWQSINFVPSGTEFIYVTNGEYKVEVTTPSGLQDFEIIVD